LRFDECAATFFEPFVRHAQFFLLHLKLFIQLLRFGERILQALAIQRGLDGVAHAVRDQLQELVIARCDVAHEAEFDDAVHDSVVFDRQHDEIARRAHARAGDDFHVIVGDVVQHERAARHGGLADQAFGIAERARRLFAFLAEAVGGDPFEAAGRAVAYIHGRDRDVEILGEKVEYRAADERRTRLADDPLREQALPRAQPYLLLQDFRVLGLAREHAVVRLGQIHQTAPPAIGDEAADRQADKQKDAHQN